MENNYEIKEVIRLRDEEHLTWKEIENIIQVSQETLRKAYKRDKLGLTCVQVNPNIYINQKQRGIKRKYEIILARGGKCECCGYNKNIAALEFHHINPEEKEFAIDSRHFSNTSLEVLQLELAKCRLLCANCHRELHNPELELEKIPILLENCSKKSFNSPETGSICPVCGKTFPKMKGKIYCSKECSEKTKGYPSKQEVLEQYELLGTWDKVAKHFGVTRKIIQGIRKKDS